jgi:hypothetical protein
MIICELSQFNELTKAQTNVAPFVYQSFPASHKTADYWINIFGAPDETISNTIFIISLIRGFTVYYSANTSLVDCIANERSFFWDSANEIFYIHYEHAQSRLTDFYEYGDVRGFSDKYSIYIDNLYYDALLQNIPSIAQQQDIINYDKLAFISGSIELTNLAGILDNLITESIIGTTVRLYYLDDSARKLDYTRNDLINLPSLYIENYEITLLKVILYVQDLRKKQNIMIPTETFTIDDYPDINEKYIDKIIKLLYGPIQSSEAIPVDGDLGIGNDINFRQAVLLKSLGTVQVEIDDLWTTKVPIAVDLTIGTFTLAEADGRKANGTPYKCRVIGSEGIINNHASDIIKDLFYRFLQISYTNSTYNQIEWEQEEKQLEEIGILFDKQIELYEAIKQIQSTANKGFRFEIGFDNRNTIRIDDPDREESLYVPNVEIQNINELLIKSDRDLLAAIIKINYAYDYVLQKYSVLEFDDNYDEVKSNNRQIPTIEIDTNLTTESQANDRAELYADRFSEVPRFATLALMGIDYFTIRIYDVLTIELTGAMVDADTGEIISGREFYGIYKCQVLGIDPDFKNQINNVTVYLIEKIDPVTTVRITTYGAIRKCRVIGTTTFKRAV